MSSKIKKAAHVKKGCDAAHILGYIYYEGIFMPRRISGYRDRRNAYGRH
jgi:hypothetical protein